MWPCFAAKWRQLVKGAQVVANDLSLHFIPFNYLTATVIVFFYNFLKFYLALSVDTFHFLASFIFLATFHTFRHLSYLPPPSISSPTIRYISIFHHSFPFIPFSHFQYNLICAMTSIFGKSFFSHFYENQF